MKTVKIIALLSFTSLIATTSCENNGFYYRDTPRVRIEAPYEWALGTDSLEFSFVTLPLDVAEKEIFVSLFIMGNATDHDRNANLEIVAGKTTATAEHYECPAQVTIPAGSIKTDFPVILKRTNDLQEKTVRLYIHVIESESFKAGVTEQDHLLFKWNDILSRPNNWNDLTEFFGDFSLEKYRFILSVTGVSKFDTAAMSWAELNNYRIKVKTALDEYNASHPNNPLKDENGQLIEF
ncbi:MAG: DUF4843 domain-containing protein [Prevotellaceae bacterium]|jgi:hypothetical protein|nr:DUF4843 domain-containing protein [Prevotellaceae bacterium]